MLVFGAVLFGLLANGLLLWVFATAPEHDRVRRLVARVKKWLVGTTTTAAGIGIWKYPEAWTYGDLHLASQSALAGLVVIDVVLIGVIVAGAFRVRRQPHVPGALGSVIGVLLVVSGALAVGRSYPTCDVLHPRTEPAMSVQRQDPAKVIMADPKGPIRPALPPPLKVTPPPLKVTPPPLKVTPPPAAPPSLGPPRALRLPPVVPGRQPEPTSEPYGGCLTHRHPD